MATATKNAPAPVAETPTLSPLEQIAALQAQLKELKSSAGEEMKADAEAKFTPLHSQMVTALAAVADGTNTDRAAHALKFLADNINDYRKIAKVYHKHVFGIAPVRKPREPKSDVASDAPAE